MRATEGLARTNMGCPHSRGGARVTRESRMMAERNAVVAAATKMIVETGAELEKAEAYAMAQDGYVRRSIQYYFKLHNEKLSDLTKP